MNADSEEPRSNKRAKFVKMENVGPISWFTKCPLKIHQYAAELRRRIASKEQTGNEVDCLAPPILDCELGGNTCIPLVGWIFFNSLGPTKAAIFYFPVPETGDGLLTCRWDNPFQRQHAAFGLLSEGDQIESAIVSLFEANGHESRPLFRSLPSSVFHNQNWQATTRPPLFGSDLSQVLFRHAARSVWPDHMQSICDRFRQFKDPLERALADHHESLNSGLTFTNERRDSFDEKQFKEWFDLTTERDHVESERQNFPIAWEGSIRLRKLRQARMN
jgi:hypothetical protein